MKTNYNKLLEQSALPEETVSNMLQSLATSTTFQTFKEYVEGGLVRSLQIKILSGEYDDQDELLKLQGALAILSVVMNAPDDFVAEAKSEAKKRT